MSTEISIMKVGNDKHMGYVDIPACYGHIGSRPLDTRLEVVKAMIEELDAVASDIDRLRPHLMKMMETEQ